MITTMCKNSALIFFCKANLHPKSWLNTFFFVLNTGKGGYLEKN